MTEIRFPSGGIIGDSPELVRRFLAQGASLNAPVPRAPIAKVSGRKVRVLAIVHGWFPALAAGSERMIQHMLDALPKDEFEVEVLSFGAGDVSGAESPYWYEGIKVTRGFVTNFKPDVIVTHHGPGSRVSRSFAEQHPGCAVVAVYHNDRYEIQDINDLDADLNVYNTKWVKEALSGIGIVVHPPLEYDRHHVETTGECVTMVNLQENKGVLTFERVAARMVDTPFLAVIGTHGPQDLTLSRYTNINLHPVTQNMKEVWAKTKVVLMPSGYESFGMVAAEACASGIPVIAHPTPGLVECLGSAGIFVDRDDTDGYERVLNLLLTDAKAYSEHSAKAALRGLELVAQTQTELRKFVTRIRRLVR